MRALFALCCVAIAAPLVAQDPGEEVAAVPFRTSYFPYVTSTPNDGLFGVARILRYQQAPWDARVTNFVEQSLDAGYSTRGSYLVRGDYRRIMVEQGWRVRARVEATREARFGQSDPLPPPDEREFLRRERQLGSIEVTHRITGGLQFAVRGAVDRQVYRGDYYELSSRYPAAISTDGLIVCITTPCPGSGVSQRITQKDAQIRAAVVFDTRNNEYDPTQGVLIEASAFTGSGGDGYVGAYGVARGWVRLHRLTRVTARIGARNISATSAIGIQHEVPAWEASFLTMGGPNSHRAIPAGLMAGPYVQFAGVELRHTLLDFGGLGAITALAFVDAGRQATPTDYVIVDDFACLSCANAVASAQETDWTVGAGGGLGLRVLRAAQLNVTAAKANGSMRWYVTSGWSW